MIARRVHNPPAHLRCVAAHGADRRPRQGRSRTREVPRLNHPTDHMPGHHTYDCQSAWPQPAVSARVTLDVRRRRRGHCRRRGRGSWGSGRRSPSSAGSRPTGPGRARRSRPDGTRMASSETSTGRESVGACLPRHRFRRSRGILTYGSDVEPQFHHIPAVGEYSELRSEPRSRRWRDVLVL